MAGSSRTTFAKRQKERARQEKQAEKAARKAQRKQESGSDAPQPGEAAGSTETKIQYDEEGQPLPLDFHDF